MAIKIPSPKMHKFPLIDTGKLMRKLFASTDAEFASRPSDCGFNYDWV